PPVHEWRAATAASSTAAPGPAAAKPKALRHTLHITREEQRLDGLELLRIPAVFGERVEHHVDPLHEPGAVPLLRGRQRDRRCIATLEVPVDAMQARAGGALHRTDRVAADVTNHDRRARAPIAAPNREAINDLRAVRWARRAERLLAGAAAAERRLAVLIRRRRLEEIGGSGDRAVVELLEWGDVHD